MSKPFSKKLILSFLAVLLFCLSVGFFLASKKPLWTDEIYTLRNTVLKYSYSEILVLDTFSKEGNICPFFYLTQKLMLDLAHYSLAAPLVENNPTWFEDRASQIAVRINPVLFMSLSIALIFYFFSRYYSYTAGIYSVLVSFSSYMTLIYIAEGRHYALWMFLTTLQILLLMNVISEENIKIFKIYLLFLVHFLLSVTVAFSMTQISLVFVLLWIFARNKVSKRHILLVTAPVFLCIHYYFRTPKYDFWFWHGPRELISANFPTDRFLIIAVYLVLVVYEIFQQKRKGEGWLSGRLGEGIPFFLYVTGMLSAAAAVLIMFKIQAIPRPGTMGSTVPGFPVPARYFIFLVPVCIVATTYFSILILRAFETRPLMKGVIILLLGSLLVFRFNRSIHNAVIYYPEFYTQYKKLNL